MAEFKEMTEKLLKKMGKAKVTNENLIGFVTNMRKQGKNIKDIIHENEELINYIRLGKGGDKEYKKFWDYVLKEVRSFNRSPERMKRLKRKAEEKGGEVPVIIKVMTEKTNK